MNNKNEDKIRAQLLAIQKSDPYNKKCVDCSANGPTFIDVKFGSFLCTRCSGLHRELGTDFCRVKSVSLDNLSTEELSLFTFTKGNTYVNSVYEAVDAKYLKPFPESEIDKVREFIRRKYKLQQFYKAPVTVSESKINTSTKISTSIPQMVFVPSPKV
jgi:stromal membrane-associated protein